ncbi:NAD-P-binding protein [Peniophora sp. CONT]|nr:NAD-P-binding protein [Peniophora sp. CONT]
MAPIRNARTYYAATPTEHIEPGVHVKYDDSCIIDLDTVKLNGGFLVKTLCLGIDPSMRMRMHGGRMLDPKIQAYVPAYELNQPLIGYGVGKVIRSEDDSYKPGDFLHGWLYHEEYSVYHGPLTAVIPFRKIEGIGLPWSVYVSVLGMPGQTAFWGWKEYSQAKAGETVFVSSAAGTVGSLIIQLAKRDGLRVIASSGSDEKAAYATECGADVSFNYKKEKVWDVLAREQQGVDVYFDNVGGEHLDAALLNANKFARFIECGMASLYNSEPYNVQNLGLIIGKAINVHGLLHHALYPQHEDEFYATVPQLVKEGAFKHREDISQGLDTVGQALHDVGSGKNFGKRVVIVAKD